MASERISPTLVRVLYSKGELAPAPRYGVVEKENGMGDKIRGVVDKIFAALGFALALWIAVSVSDFFSQIIASGWRPQ